VGFLSQSLMATPHHHLSAPADELAVLIDQIFLLTFILLG
jgi:hypothetical protein